MCNAHRELGSVTHNHLQHPTVFSFVAIACVDTMPSCCGQLPLAARKRCNQTSERLWLTVEVLCVLLLSFFVSLCRSCFPWLKLAAKTFNARLAKRILKLLLLFEVDAGVMSTTFLYWLGQNQSR